MNGSYIQRIKFTAPLALAIGSMPFSIPVCHFALLVLVIAWIIEGKWKEKAEIILKNHIVLIFFFFFLLHLFGIFYSEDRSTAWYSLEKKAALFALPIVLASTKLEKEDIGKLLHLFIITCLAASLICLYIAFGKAIHASPTFNFDSYTNTSFYSFNTHVSSLWMYFSYIELASGISIHPSYLSLYLAFCILLIVHFYSTTFETFSLTKKILILLLLFYLGMFILFLSSRIMIFTFLIISVYGLKQFLKEAPPLTLWMSSLSLLFLFLSIVYLNPVSRFRSYQEVITTYPYLRPGLQTQSTTIRASLWSLSIKSLHKINLVFGAGTGDVEQLISETSERANVTNVMGTNDPHNQYLQTLLGLGILGLSALLICFAWPALVSYQTGNFLYLGFIFLFAILCLTETAMELQKGIVFYSLFSSLILFQYNPAPIATFHTAKA